MPMPRTLPWDWYAGEIPANVVVDETAYIETSFSFLLCRSRRDPAVRLGRGASTYLGTMFDVGPHGSVTLGDYALVHGARIVCDGEITLGDYTVVSWNVVLMDTYRVPTDPDARRLEAARVPTRTPRRIEGDGAGRPIHIGSNVWIGFDACVMPGVTIGDGAVVGARSVVTTDVEPYSVVVGNPARMVRRLTGEEQGHDR